VNPKMNGLSSSPKVVVIILNWDGKQDTVECIESLLCSKYSNLDIFVVDNGSHDDSVYFIYSWFPSIRIIENEENLGFTGGFNIGLKEAIGAGADYVLCLNNDTLIDELMINELVDIGERSEDIGGLCPREYDYKERNKIIFAGGKIGLFRNKNLGYGYQDNEWKDQIAETEMLCGAAMMFKSKAVETVGFFDNKYFFDWEDKDYALRLRRDGFRLVYVPSAKIWHKRRGSTNGKVSGLSIYFSLRNQILFIKKNRPKALIPLLLLHVIIYKIPLVFIKSLLSRMNPIRSIMYALIWHIDSQGLLDDASMVKFFRN